MESCSAALERLCDPLAEVSAHYLVSEAGEVLALVPEEARAWHAGAGVWGDVSDVNSRSIGIELANTGTAPFPEPQMTALEALLSEIMARWNIRPERVIAHSDMAPDRKSDPGPHFDWRRLALAGLSVWPESDLGPGQPRAAFCNLARCFGYRADVSENHLLRAFRLRFRPGASGPCDALDLRMIKNLSHRFPVDPDGAST